MEPELDLIKKTLNVLYNRMNEMEKEIKTLKKNNCDDKEENNEVEDNEVKKEK